MDDIALTTYPVERLREFSTRVFAYFGVPEADARLAADVLATSDLRGIVEMRLMRRERAVLAVAPAGTRE